MSRLSIENFMLLNDTNGNKLKVRSLTGKTGFAKKLSSSHINRPGMNLFGFFDFFAHDRVQIFGRGEVAYLKQLDEKADYTNVEKIFEHDIPLCLFSNSSVPPDAFLSLAEKYETSVLLTELSTGECINKLTVILEQEFAPIVTMHGVFIEVFGIGVLIKGKSGVGKSEAALELIERGHRLIADDSVDFKRIHENQVIGTNNKILKYNMEMRGLGIVNIARLSGMSAVRDKQELEIIINLEDWDETKEYDRTGLEDISENVLGVDIPSHTVPVRPGRNIYVLIETAVKNLRLKRMGYHSARMFNDRLMSLFEGRDPEVFL